MLRLQHFIVGLNNAASAYLVCLVNIWVYCRSDNKILITFKISKVGSNKYVDGQIRRCVLIFIDRNGNLNFQNVNKIHAWVCS